MNRYLKISAALAAFALLLVVMGLSTSGSVQAQAAVSLTSTASYVCSLGADEDCTNMTTIGLTDGTSAQQGSITVRNLDVAEVADINPKTFPTVGTSGQPITFVQNFSGSPANEIRAFNGNRIQLMHRPATGFATFKTLTVDNVDPTLVINSPAIPLVVKGSTDVTFSANITDSGSGYTTDGTTAGSIALGTGAPGGLATDGGSTTAGGVRMLVAGNVVDLGDSNFTAIDGGWNVWATINSSAIQNLGANVPWYFETRDRAGNTQRTSGSVALKPGDDGAMTGIEVGTSNSVVDSRFVGGLPASSFGGTMMKVTRGSNSKTVAIRVVCPGNRHVYPHLDRSKRRFLHGH